MGLGALVLFVLLNVMAFCFRSFAFICRWIMSGIKLFFKMPLFMVLWEFYGTMRKSEEEDRKKGEKKEKEKELFDRLELLEKNQKLNATHAYVSSGAWRVDEEAGAEDDKKEDSEEKGREKKRGKLWCDFCKRSGHTEEECFQKLRCDYCGYKGHGAKDCWTKMRHQLHGKPKGWSRKIPDKKEPEEPRKEELEPSGKEPEEGTSDGMVMRAEDGSLKYNNVLLHVPATINEKKVAKVLVDTGAEVNVISPQDAGKLMLSVDAAGVKTLSAFNGFSTPIEGTTRVRLAIGPNEQPRDVEFWVAKGVKEPVVGMRVLRDFGLSVDCESGCLVENGTGRRLCCSLLRKN